MKKIIILMGVPGSGKGTQAMRLADRFDYAHISTGDLLRALDADSDADPVDKQKLADMKVGRLVSDNLIYRLAFREIEKNIESGKGVILDGAIRNVEQAKAYQNFFTDKNLADEVIVIEVAIDDETSLERLMYRRENAAEVRADDDPEIMKKRIREQGNDVIQPILEYYESLGLLTRIDGMSSSEGVEELILNALQK